MSKIEAKKSLGQHFLSSDKLLQKIVETGRIEPADVILEIGPGYGHLTEKLLQKAGKVVAVEKDDRLISILQEKFAAEISSGRFEIVHADILTFELSYSQLIANRYKLIANLPYYITGKFLRKFLEAENKPLLAVLMLQKEVAGRIVSQKGSILSISVKTFGKPKYVATVKRGNFKPQPKVDSAILLIDEISGNFFREIHQEKFFKILKAGFAQKRKKLIGNLSHYYDKELLFKAFSQCGIEENARAEELGLENWRQLTQYIEKYKSL